MGRIKLAVIAAACVAAATAAVAVSIVIAMSIGFELGDLVILSDAERAAATERAAAAERAAATERAAAAERAAATERAAAAERAAAERAADWEAAVRESVEAWDRDNSLSAPPPSAPPPSAESAPPPSAQLTAEQLVAVRLANSAASAEAAKIAPPVMYRYETLSETIAMWSIEWLAERPPVAGVDLGRHGAAAERSAAPIIEYALLADDWVAAWAAERSSLVAAGKVCRAEVAATESLAKSNEYELAAVRAKGAAEACNSVTSSFRWMSTTAVRPLADWSALAAAARNAADDYSRAADALTVEGDYERAVAARGVAVEFINVADRMDVRANSWPNWQVAMMDEFNDANAMGIHSNIGLGGRTISWGTADFDAETGETIYYEGGGDGATDGDIVLGGDWSARVPADSFWDAWATEYALMADGR